MYLFFISSIFMGSVHMDHTEKLGSVHILGDLTIKHIASLLYTDRTLQDHTEKLWDFHIKHTF